MGRAPYTPDDKKINYSSCFLFTNYVPGVLLTSPLIFGMILPGGNNYPGLQMREQSITAAQYLTKAAAGWGQSQDIKSDLPSIPFYI